MPSLGRVLMITAVVAAFAPTDAFAPTLRPASAWRPVRVAAMTMQERGGNRDKVFVKGKESIERAKQLDKANSGDEPSLIMREKEFEWPFPLSFLNTLKKEQPQAYKAFQLAWFLGVLALACWPGVFN